MRAGTQSDLQVFQSAAGVTVTEGLIEKLIQQLQSLVERHKVQTVGEKEKQVNNIKLEEKQSLN